MEGGAYYANEVLGGRGFQLIGGISRVCSDVDDQYSRIFPVVLHHDDSLSECCGVCVFVSGCLRKSKELNDNRLQILMYPCSRQITNNVKECSSLMG